MNAIQAKARELMEAGTVRAVLGYAPGSFGGRRPLVARSVQDADALVFDEACTMNLTGLLAKEEVRRLGRLAVLGGPVMLRSLLQLMAERQVKDGEILAVVADGDAFKTLETAAAIEEHLALVASDMPAADRARMDALRAMSLEERWAWWQQELGRCVKCYACRQVCPMCYCAHCTMDNNRPQWVPVASHALGNFEYHVVRAMHLAGRCVQCGECGKACPVGIPVHLLTMFAEESAARQFGQRAGHTAKLDYALSTFRPDDKESFIR
jgi:formate dehydrogenase (coenzyme F420) beta subunit